MGEVKRGGCNTHYIRIMDLINRINLGSKFVRLIEPHEKIERFLVKKGVLSYGVLDLNTLCRSCFNHKTFVGLLYLSTLATKFSQLSV